MAVGDVVSELSVQSTYLIFQPASGVNVVVSSIFRATAEAYGLYDGTNWSYSSTPITDGGANIKIFLTNSIYLKINVVGGGGFTSFSGIQIK
tara:strand:- start:665 stop:940 length:276 start_codon:yes stop_codon:yes gene_type:complete